MTQRVTIGYIDSAGNHISIGKPSTPYRNINLGVTGQVLKASAGTLAFLHVINTGAAVRFVKLYDKATAPTSADTPTHTIAVPAGGSQTIQPDAGIPFANGISMRASTLVADADNTGPGANEVLVNAGWR